VCGSRYGSYKSCALCAGVAVARLVSRAALLPVRSTGTKAPSELPTGQRWRDASPAPLTAAVSIALTTVLCSPVWAAMDAGESLYNPEQGSETFKNIAGVGYIILVIFYFFRLFKKRAEKAAAEPLASTALSKNKSREGEEAMNDLAALDGPAPEGGASAAPADVTITQCLIGVAQAGTICFGFYLLSRVVDDYFLHQDLPAQYTARNVTLLIQSVVRGLVYLITFIFGANATGLAALAVQMVVDPEGVDRGLDQRVPKKKEVLPKVKVTDDIGSLRRAFKEAERMGQKEKNTNSRE
jgi:hypothetical protein